MSKLETANSDLSQGPTEFAIRNEGLCYERGAPPIFGPVVQRRGENIYFSDCQVGGCTRGTEGVSGYDEHTIIPYGRCALDQCLDREV